MKTAENHRVYLALGSNLGDRLANLEQALKALPPAARVEAFSPVYETDPWGYTDQPAFLNMVACLRTAFSPQALLDFLKRLETRLGRRPTFKNGPRLIDLDILFYDDWVLDEPGLKIPHPHLHERGFVLAPLADLAPELRHPVLGKTIEELKLTVGMEGVHPFPSSLDRAMLDPYPPRGDESEEWRP